MQQASPSNKKIAKNTFFLYIRMFVMMGVGLYTSRVILEALGTEDYGVYNIVGGVVIFLSFMNGALVNATQRFLNFALGQNKKQEFHKIFCMSLNMYIIWGVMAIVLSETFGLWFINTQISLPENRIIAANWVFQFSIATFVINLLRTPYHSAILAHERMVFYAYSTMAEAILKLLVVYFLFISPYDNLIFYSFLYMVVPLLINGCYYIFCYLSFWETRYQWMWDKAMFKELFTFSSLSLFGNLAGMTVIQGVNITLNWFYGVTVNAAAGLANQVSSQVYGFVTNFQTAFQPQIVKSYAANNHEDFHKLIYRSAKFSYFLLFIVVLPLLLTTKMVFTLWLKEVPEYAIEFSQMILVFQLIEVISTPLWMAVQAQGDIKKYQIVISVILLLSLPLSYFVLWIGCPPYWVWLTRSLLSIVSLAYRLIYLRQKVSLSIRKFVSEVLKPIIVVTLLALPIPLYLKYFTANSTTNNIIIILTCGFFTTLLIGLIGLSKSERAFLNKIIKQKITNEQIL